MSTETEQRPDALERWQPRGGASIMQRLRAEYDPGQLDLIRNTVAKDLNEAELGLFLELCARYELDPFAKQVWGAKIGGSPTVIVAHAGLLTIAERYPDFRGVVSDVVRQNDHFKKAVAPDGSPQVEHSYEGSDDKRGEIVGAWAIVYRDGRIPYYFFANWKEYAGQNVWKKQPSVMIDKCAQSVALRRAFTITGVVAEEETGKMQRLTEPGTGAPVEPEYGEDPMISGRLRQLFDLLGYTKRKRVLKLLDRAGVPVDDSGRMALIDRMMAEARERGIEVPPFDAEADAVEDRNSE